MKLKAFAVAQSRQSSISVSLAYSIRLCKNQCRNVHVSRRHQKKCFKPWTTVYVNMITHTHAQIAGSCRLDGKSVQVSRFAAFYPRVLAKKLAEVTIHPVHKHVDVPAAVNFHTCLPVRALEHPENSNESLPKRARGNDDVPKTEKPPRKKRRYEEPSPVKVNDQKWKDQMNDYRLSLPKSGIDGMDQITLGLQ